MDSALHCDGGGADESINLFVRSQLNSFDNNQQEIALFDLSECELEISESSISDHHFVISSKVAIIDAFNLQTDNASFLFLDNSRNSDASTVVNILSTSCRID